MRRLRPRSAAAILAAALPLLLALLTGCEQPSAQPAETASGPVEVARNVRVLEVGVSDLAESVEITGPVQPVRGADISAEEGGRLLEVVRDRGARVARGEALLRLDRRTLDAEIDAVRAELAAQDHNVDGVRELRAAGKVSEQALLEAEAMAARTRATLRSLEVRRERTAIPAPFDGLVTDRYVEPGELVAPGAVVARVLDPYTLKLEGAVTEQDVAWIREGAPARVTLDGHDAPVDGVVHWVGFEADPASGKFKVEIRLQNPDLALRSGVVGRARVQRRVLRDVVAIPRDAVLTTAEGAAVYTVSGDRAHLQHVQLGPDQGLMVAVEKGLAPGDLLVVRGHRDLVRNALVDVTERATRRDGGTDGDPAEVTEASAGREAGEEASR
ncbi:MAG TPA: efflux RND transporter periplasmic adaptor subunit [Candidatus Krumholzibacteria bacterium]|nr:efflux RND transporter periplasmic adaptor subunit [Candidatus Krumholzibacteria bacterium]